MSVLEFPGGGSNKEMPRYHIMIEYEGADGQSHLAEDVGHLTTIGGFVCISRDASESGYYLPPVMIAFDRVIRIDADETSTVN